MFVIIQRKAGNVIMLLSRCDGISVDVCPCNPVDVCFETFRKKMCSSEGREKVLPFQKRESDYDFVL